MSDTILTSIKGRKTGLAILLLLLTANVCLSKDLPNSFVFSKIESPNLSKKELEELSRALKIQPHERVQTAQLDAALKKIYSEGTYEVLFLDVTQKGKENILVIKGNKLKKMKEISFSGLDGDLANEFKKDVEVREGRLVGSKYLANIRSRIEGMLEQRGYFYSKTEIKQTETDEGIKLEFIVEKNKPTKVRKISFKGVSETLEDEIRNYLVFAPGDVFRKVDLEKSSENINKYFKQNQYPTTRIEDTTLVFSQDKLLVDVVFLVKQGEKFQFQFVGNTVYPEVLLREFLTEEVLSQADATNKMVNLIESKYKAAGYHFCQVKIEIESIPLEKLNVVYFRIDEGKKLRIDRIDFNGGERVGQSTLEKWMYGEAPGVLALGVYWEAGLSEMTQKLQMRMRKEGYLSATVSAPRSVFTEDRAGVELIFEVQPGQRTYLHDVDIEGVQRLDKNTILKEVKFKKNETFNIEKAESIKSSILDVYLREGFTDVQLKGAFRNAEYYEISLDQKQADIKLIVTEGPQYYVGDIVLEGNKRTDADVIERELKIHRGDKYDLQKVRASEDEVNSLGLFSRVEIVSSSSSKGTNLKDLRVIVVESKRGFGEVGLGAAYEDPRFRLRTFLGLGYKNLFGRNHTASARSEVDMPFSDGYKLIPFLEYSINLGYRMPYPLALPFIFTSQAGLDSYELASAEDRTFVKLQSRTRIEERIERKVSSVLTLIYRLHHYERTRTEYLQLKARDISLAALPGEVTENIGSTGPGIILDLRNDPFNPTKGSFHTFDFELASKVLLSQSDFYLAMLRNSFYLPIYNSFGFTFFVGGGFSESTTTDGVLPKTRLENELALGGQGSIRGYPLKIFYAQEDDKSQAYYQAAAYYNTRLELSIPIITDLSLAVFMDSGQIYSRKKEQVWKTYPRYDGIGVGFRYKTPVGPVVFDMAEGLTAPGKVVKFLFNIGTF